MRSRAGGEPPRPPDLRLVPAALSAWLVVLLGIGLGPVAGGVLVGGTAAVAAAGWRRRWPPQVLAAAGCAAAAGVVISAQLTLVAGHPLRGPAERGAAATVRVVITDDPRPIRADPGAPTPGPASVLVPARVIAVEVGDERWSAGGRVLVIAPAEGWAGLLPGQQATADGLLAPPTRSGLLVAVLRVRGAPGDPAGPPWWQDAAGGLRSGLRGAAAAVLPPGPAGLLPGLSVGDRTLLTPEVEDDFTAAGLTHLLAVSGANLAIVGGAVLALARLFRADPRLAAVLSAGAVIGFVVLARPSPSVLRAAVMGGIVLLALASGRGRSALPALAAAVLVLLLADPALAVDPGFALSVVATGALVLLAPAWAEAAHRRGMPRWAAEALAVPAAAFLATAPLVAGLNGTVNPVAVLANLLAVPAVAPATVLGVLAAVLSPLGPLLALPPGWSPAELSAWVAGPAVGWLVLVADRAAAVPGAVLPWPDGMGGGLLLAAVVLVLLLLARSRRWRALLAAAVLGLAVVLVPTRILPPGWPPPGWAVVACDVGQGDALVLATGEPGWAVLVDAGPDAGLVDACLRRLGVRGIALVLISHLHADHMDGLGGALRGRPVGGVAVGPVREPRHALVEAGRRAAEVGAPLVALAPGQRLRWPRLVLDVLGPRHPDPAPDPDDGTAVNDGSLVVRARTTAGTVLLSGDIELAAQSDLLAAGTDLRADVLKMPHHGSRSTSPTFLDAVRPRAVLVSVGAGNTYRHPDPTLLGRLEAGGAVVRRTDTAGDIAVIAPGRRRAGRTGGVRGRDPGQPATRRTAAALPLPSGALGRSGRPSAPLAHPCAGGRLSGRRRRGPPERPCWWRAPSRSGRSARTPRPGSSGRRR
jgi:competence protein ComEC